MGQITKLLFMIVFGVLFWKDKWCGEDSFEEAFPSLYSLASFKDAQVVQMQEQLGEMGH